MAAEGRTYSEISQSVTSRLTKQGRRECLQMTLLTLFCIARQVRHVRERGKELERHRDSYIFSKIFCLEMRKVKKLGL